MYVCVCVCVFDELVVFKSGVLMHDCQTLMGTDIADLLLDGHEPESRAYSRASATPISQVVEGSANASITDDGLPATSIVDTNSAELSDRFRHLLLHGRKKVNTAVCDMLRSLCEP